MPKTKLAITLERDLVADLDALIADHQFANRSQAIEAALAEKLARLAHTRLAQEAAKLDAREEKESAEEGVSTDGRAWPAY
jgi:metal-responsive CopG/Arc/MetJ family transcriptional regulator